MSDEMKRNWDFLRDGPEEVHRGDLIGSPIMRNCEIEMYRQWDARLRRVEAMLEKLVSAVPPDNSVDRIMRGIYDDAQKYEELWVERILVDAEKHGL